MRQFSRVLLAIAAFGVAAVAGPIPVVTLQLDPIDGFVQGAAGTSVGWGFELSTDSGFVTIESISFQESSPIGTFTAFIPNAVASAGSPIIAPWVQDTLGLQYDIDPAAILNASTLGPMTVVYDAFSDAAQTDQIVFGQFLNATDAGGSDINAEVLVNAAGATVPEPGAILLCAVGVGLVALGKRARQKVRMRFPSMRHRP